MFTAHSSFLSVRGRQILLNFNSAGEQSLVGILSCTSSLKLCFRTYVNCAGCSVLVSSTMCPASFAELSCHSWSCVNIPFRDFTASLKSSPKSSTF